MSGKRKPREPEDREKLEWRQIENSPGIGCVSSLMAHFSPVLLTFIQFSTNDSHRHETTKFVYRTMGHHHVWQVFHERTTFFFGSV